MEGVASLPSSGSMEPVHGLLLNDVKQAFSGTLSLQSLLFYAVVCLFEVISPAFPLSFLSHALAQP